jgi:hypothetical protein
MTLRIAELNKQLTKKKSKLKLAQEKNTECLQQVNQQLQEKSKHHQRFTELHIQFGYGVAAD